MANSCAHIYMPYSCDREISIADDRRVFLLSRGVRREVNFNEATKGFSKYVRVRCLSGVWTGPSIFRVQN